MKRMRRITPRILWQDLKGVKAVAFKEKLEGCFRLEEDVEQMWTTMANSIRIMARWTLGVTSGKVNDHKESWWWSDDVQAKVKFKKGCFMEFLSCPDGPERPIKRALFQVANKMAKKAVAEAKAKAYKEMYRHLNTKEGVNKIFKLA